MDCRAEGLLKRCQPQLSVGGRLGGGIGQKQTGTSHLLPLPTLHIRHQEHRTVLPCLHVFLLAIYFPRDVLPFLTLLVITVQD